MKYRVAIIEDSVVLSNMLSELLTEIGNVKIAITATGQQSALLKLTSSHVDLVIVDLELDEGNGLGVIEGLHGDPGKYGQPKTVIFSNYVILPVSRRCNELGVDGIFDKSFQLPELLSFVKSEISQSQPAAGT